jgi:hypothetical protein
MDAIFNSLRPRTPEPSFEDLFSDFSMTQFGEGVLTRRQARLAQQQPQPATETEIPAPNLEADTVPQVEDNTSREVIEPDRPPDTDRSPETGSPSEPEPEADDETAPYLKDTLVAENEDLQAYVIKTHFRKMKNFV